MVVGLAAIAVVVTCLVVVAGTWEVNGGQYTVVVTWGVTLLVVVVGLWEVVAIAIVSPSCVAAPMVVGPSSVGPWGVVVVGACGVVEATVVATVVVGGVATPMVVGSGSTPCNRHISKCTTSSPAMATAAPAPPRRACHMSSRPSGHVIMAVATSRGSRPCLLVFPCSEAPAEVLGTSGRSPPAPVRHPHVTATSQKASTNVFNTAMHAKVLYKLKNVECNTPVRAPAGTRVRIAILEYTCTYSSSHSSTYSSIAIRTRSTYCNVAILGASRQLPVLPLVNCQSCHCVCVLLLLPARPASVALCRCNSLVGAPAQYRYGLSILSAGAQQSRVGIVDRLIDRSLATTYR